MFLRRSRNCSYALELGTDGKVFMGFDTVGVVREGLPVVIGAVVAIGLGWLVAKRLLARIERETKAEFSKEGRVFPVPTMIPEDVWRNEILLETPGGVHLGHLECFIFFSAFWMPGGWAVAAAYLAFKLASKWDSWKSLGEIPKRQAVLTVKSDERERKEETEQLVDLRARVYRTSLTHRKFVVGTAANIAAGLIGAGVAQAVDIGLRTVQAV